MKLSQSSGHNSVVNIWSKSLPDGRTLRLDIRLVKKGRRSNNIRNLGVLFIGFPRILEKAVEEISLKLVKEKEMLPCTNVQDPLMEEFALNLRDTICVLFNLKYTKKQKQYTLYISLVVVDSNSVVQNKYLVSRITAKNFQSLLHVGADWRKRAKDLGLTDEQS